MIYLDNAATTMQKPEEVIQAVVTAMQSMGNAGRGRTQPRWKHRERYMTRERSSVTFLGEKIPVSWCSPAIPQRV